MAVEIVVLSPLALRLSIRERHEVVLLVVVGLYGLVDRVGVGGVVHGLVRLSVSIRERPDFVLSVGRYGK